jgi:hypothetical protein
MFRYENHRHQGWTKEWIDKINKHPMISKDTLYFFDLERFNFLDNNAMKIDLSIRKMLYDMQGDFWSKKFSKSYAKRLLKNLDKLELTFKKLKVQQKLDKIKEDF